MTGNEIAASLAARHGLTNADARKLIDEIFTAIAAAAARGEETSIHAFGKFKVKDTPARDGRNPRTGETIVIKAARKLTFTPAKAVRDGLNR